MNLPFTLLGFLIALLVVTLCHEMGHLLIARLFRVPVKRIALGLGPTLWQHSLDSGITIELRTLPVGMMIGVIPRRGSDGHIRRPVEQDIAVAAAGPIVSLLLAIVLISVAAILGPASGLQAWLVATAVLSLALAVLNLIPLPGLDGGHLVLLGLARLGLQLSPRREVMVHRVGFRLAAVLCAMIVVARGIGVA